MTDDFIFKMEPEVTTYSYCLEFLSEFQKHTTFSFSEFIYKIKFKLYNNYNSTFLQNLSEVVGGIMKIYDACIQMKALFQNVSNRKIHDKIYNSSYEIILFIDNIIQEIESMQKCLKNLVYYLPLPRSNYNQLYIDVFYSCFQDIYALDYIIKNPPANYFSFGNIYKILDMIYLLKMKEIEDEEKWMKITSDDSDILLSHPLLPYPDDFKKISVT
jgi:hypothetical protein